MVMISLKYEVATATDTPLDSGVLQCDVSYIENSYNWSNASQLLQPLFIPGNVDGSNWTINNDTFKSKIIVGTQTSNWQQGGYDLLGFIASADFYEGTVSLQNFLDSVSVNPTKIASADIFEGSDTPGDTFEGSVNPTTITPVDEKAVLTFIRNAEHDGLENRPLDYFDVISGYVPNRMSNLELQGYRVATTDATTVSFKIGCYILIELPDSDVSYIHIPT